MELKTRTTIKESTAILYHVDISRRYFFVCKLKIVFYFLHELKQRSRDVTRRHLRSKVFQKTSDIQDACPNLARKTGTLSLTSKSYVLLELQILKHTVTTTAHAA